MQLQNSIDRPLLDTDVEVPLDDKDTESFCSHEDCDVDFSKSVPGELVPFAEPTYFVLPQSWSTQARIAMAQVHKTRFCHDVLLVC